MKEAGMCASWGAFFRGSIILTMELSLKMPYHRSESFGSATWNLLKCMELLNAQNLFYVTIHT